MRTMRRMAIVVALGRRGEAWPMGAQGYRIRLDTRFQSVTYRGLAYDSLLRTDVKGATTPGFRTPDGYAAFCAPAATYCSYYKPGGSLAASPVAETMDAGLWGFGGPGLQVRVVVQRVAVQGREGRHARGLQQPRDLPLVARGAPGGQDGVQRILVGLARGRSAEARVGGRGGLAHGAAEGLPLRRTLRGQGHPLVVPGAAVHAVRRVLRVAVGHGPEGRVAQGVVHPALEGRAEHGLPHGQVDHLPRAAVVARDQGRQDGEGRVHAAVGVAIRQAHVLRLAVRVAGGRGDAGPGPDQRPGRQ